MKYVCAVCGGQRARFAGLCLACEVERVKRSTAMRETRGYHLRVPLTPSEREDLEAAADGAGETLAEYARDAIFARVHARKG